MSPPRCKQGDLAWIIKSLNQANRRKIVTVSTYVGYFNQNDSYDHNGIKTSFPITDHYWWIECPEGIETIVGPMSRAIAPDTWLEPIKPTLLDDEEETGDEIYNIIPVETT